MSKLIVPDSEDQLEMAGRMYEAIDVARAIESGQINTLDEVLKNLNKSADSLGRLLKCKQWIIGDNNCVDILASIAINQEEFISQEEADNSDRANLAQVLGVDASEISNAALADLRCGPHDEAVRERWKSKPWLQ